MKHLIVTRFNVKGIWRRDKSSMEVLTPDWMNHRLALFEQYCLPSLQKQSVQDFLWLLYFDRKTKKDQLDRVEELRKKFPNIVLRFVSNISEAQEDLKEYIKEVSKEGESIITTRIDNDDAFAYDALEDIRIHSSSFDKVFIDLQRGVRFDLSRNRAFQTDLNAGPFSSLKEPAESCETVWSRAHSEWANETGIPKVKLDHKLYWFQAIHERNQRNDIKSHYLELSLTKVSDRFEGFRVKLESIWTVKRLWHNIVVRPITLFVRFLNRVLRRVLGSR